MSGAECPLVLPVSTMNVSVSSRWRMHPRRGETGWRAVTSLDIHPAHDPTFTVRTPTDAERVHLLGERHVRRRQSQIGVGLQPDVHLGRGPQAARGLGRARQLAGGDQALFWRRDNWQALCASCHSRHKQRIERSGTVIGCDVDGIPLDPRHAWAKGEGGSNL